SFIRSTIEFLQSRFSRCSAASFARIASTSVCEIGFPAVAPAGVADADGACDEAGGGDDPGAPVTPAPCLGPKMADTLFPKTLISSSYFCSEPSARLPGAPKEGCARKKDVYK